MALVLGLGVGCLCFGVFKVSLLQSVKSHVVQQKT